MNEVFVPCDIAPQESQGVRPFTGGPKPEALIITCSECSLDRPLWRRFQHQPVFVLRTFGYEVDESIHAEDEFCDALEEAVCWWQVPRIVVCGHSDCCAYRGRRHEASHPTSQEVGRRSTFQSMLQRRTVAQHANCKAMCHAIDQLTALQSYPCIAERLQEDRIELSAAFYLHESGLFLKLGEQREEFQ